MSALILYTTEDGRSQIKLRADQQAVWLTQHEIAELFDATKQNISLHLKNIFEDDELDPAATVKESLTTAADGTHAGRVSHGWRRAARRRCTWPLTSVAGSNRPQRPTSRTKPN